MAYDLQPTIGRIVHYSPHQPDDVCYAATITETLTESGFVSLTVFEPNKVTQVFDVPKHLGDPGMASACGRQYPAHSWHWPERI